MMHRRELLGTALTIGTASVLKTENAISEDKPKQPKRIVDTNVSLFRWPFRRLPLDETEKLIGKFRSLGITQAWAGSYEGVFHRDLTAANARLAKACKRYPEFVAVGSVNPLLPSWEEDLQRCTDIHRMPAIRLHPNYHGYTLSDPRLVKLVKRAAAAGRLIQIAVTLEDTRTQHPLMRVPDVDLAPLPKLMREIPAATVQILNDRPRGPLLNSLAESTQVLFDTARVEATDGIATLIEKVSSKRVMFGSHAPFLVPEAALIRTSENELEEEQLQSLLWGNAVRVLKMPNP